MHRDLSHGITEPLVTGLLNFVAATSDVLSESVEGCSSFVNRPLHLLVFCNSQSYYSTFCDGEQWDLLICLQS